MVQAMWAMRATQGCFLRLLRHTDQEIQIQIHIQIQSLYAISINISLYDSVAPTNK